VRCDFFVTLRLSFLRYQQVGDVLLRTLVPDGSPATSCEVDFVVLANDHLEDVLQRAQLAGLTIAPWGGEV
jgi:hypothetical protein